MRQIKNEDLILELIPQTITEKNRMSVGGFALSFNGYEYGGSFERCAEIANKARLAIEENKTEELTLSELRNCLFFHYRASYHTGSSPIELRVNTLLKLIRDRVSKNEME